MSGNIATGANNYMDSFINIANSGGLDSCCCRQSCGTIASYNEEQETVNKLIQNLKQDLHKILIKKIESDSKISIEKTESDSKSSIEKTESDSKSSIEQAKDDKKISFMEAHSLFITEMKNIVDAKLEIVNAKLKKSPLKYQKRYLEQIKDFPVETDINGDIYSMEYNILRHHSSNNVNSENRNLAQLVNSKLFTGRGDYIINTVSVDGAIYQYMNGKYRKKNNNNEEIKADIELTKDEFAEIQESLEFSKKHEICVPLGVLYTQKRTVTGWYLIFHHIAHDKSNLTKYFTFPPYPNIEKKQKEKRSKALCYLLFLILALIFALSITAIAVAQI